MKNWFYDILFLIVIIITLLLGVSLNNSILIYVTLFLLIIYITTMSIVVQYYKKKINEYWKNKKYNELISYLNEKLVKLNFYSVYNIFLINLFIVYMLQDDMSNINNLLTKYNLLFKYSELDYYLYLISLENESANDANYYFQSLLKHKDKISEKQKQNAKLLNDYINNKNRNPIDSNLPIVKRICDRVDNNEFELKNKINVYLNDNQKEKATLLNVIFSILSFLSIIVGFFIVTIGLTPKEIPNYLLDYEFSINNWKTIFAILIPLTILIISLFLQKKYNKKMTVSIVFSIIFIIFECINGFGAINNKKNYDYDNSHIEYVETKLGIDLPNDAKVIWNGKYAGEVTVKDNLTLDEGIIIFKNELDLSLIDSNKFKKDLTEEDKAFIPCDYKEGFVDYEYFSILCLDDGTYFNYKNTKDKKYLACGYDIDSKIFYIQIFKKI